MKRIRRACVLIVVILFILFGNTAFAYEAIPNEMLAVPEISDDILMCDVNGERQPGPLSEEEEIGVEQIQKAGISDKTFATVVYLALKADTKNYDKYFSEELESSSIRNILRSYDGEIDASVQPGKTNPLPEIKNEDGSYKYEKYEKIKSMEGLIWLQHAKEINLELNQISDLREISTKTVSETLGISESDAERMKWFRDGVIGKFTVWMVSGNPITDFDESNVGGIELYADGGVWKAGKIETLEKEGTAIHGGTKNWSTSYTIMLPELYSWTEGKKTPLNISGMKENRTFIAGDGVGRGEGIVLDREAIRTRNLPVTGINHSGDIKVMYGHDGMVTTHPAVMFEVEDGYSEMLSTRGESLGFSCTQRIRIYYPVTAKSDSEISATVLLKKEAAVSSTAEEGVPGEERKRVNGAVFALYRKGNEETVINTYETKTQEVNGVLEDGIIQVKEELLPGTYILKEIKAAEGYELNENENVSYEFEVKDTNRLEIAGGDRPEAAEEGKVYIDRYSEPIEITAFPEENYELNKVCVSYQDGDTQENMTKEFDNTTDAENWLNSAEARGDKNTVGCIDGWVEVTGQFSAEFSEENILENRRPTMSFSFLKTDTEGTALEGAVFGLKCNHRHTDKCKAADGSYSLCECPHTDDFRYLTDIGCSWESEAICAEDGVVSFGDLNSAEYTLVEKDAPEGYLRPEGNWTVKADAEEKTIEISSTEESMSAVEAVSGEEEYAYRIENKDFQLTIEKVGESESEKLKDAAFRLEKENEDNSWSSVGEELYYTDEAGQIQVRELGYGTYKLTEAEPPTGYQLLDAEIVFTISYDEELQKNVFTSKVTGEDEQQVSVRPDEKDSGKVTIVVSNQEGLVFPETGGSGLSAKMISLGIVLMGAAAYFLTGQRKKKRRN